MLTHSQVLAEISPMLAELQAVWHLADDDPRRQLAIAWKVQLLTAIEELDAEDAHYRAGLQD
jgi:hypothetical protein